MPSQASSPTSPPTYPWYDDRVKQIRSSTPSPWAPLPSSVPTPWDDGPMPDVYDTPKKIYEYLDTCVYKQEDAKRAAAIIMYQCLQGIKSNALFIGPTGCGKTHTWRMLQKIFPGMIEIRDASSVTMDGWKGTTKWRDLLYSPTILSGHPAVLVLDEADKMLMPKYSSHGENVSHGVQSEGLTMLEGTIVEFQDGPITYTIDTAQVSFVLCGAFSNKAHDLAEQRSQRHIGFGAAQPDAALPYDTGLTTQDLIDYGVMPEFLGRIQRTAHLQPMTAEDYYRMTEGPNGILRQIQRQYGMEIRITPEKRWELAQQAYENGLGVRGMEGKIRQLIDDAIFDDCYRESLEI